MTKTVVEKEQLNTKDNIIQNSNHNITTDTQSYIDPLSVNDIPIENIDSDTLSFRDYLPLVYVFVSIVIFICSFSTAFAIANKNSTKIIEGVSVNGINISGLTTEEATQKLSNEFSKKLNSTLTLKHQDYTLEFIPAQDMDASYDIQAVVEKAYSLGRSGNLIQNNYEIIASGLAKKKITIGLYYDNQKLEEYIKNMSLELPGLVINPSYYTEDNNIIILKGSPGIELLQSETKNLLISNIENLSISSCINLPTQIVKPLEINIEKIHEEIYSEPENAYIIQEPFELNIGSPGTDFAISLEEAKNLLQEEKSEYIIPLKIIPQEIGVEDLGNEVFADNLGNYSSKYSVSNKNRTINVELATKKINNVILLPGETFSYNQVVGERTFSNGFREASVYTSSGVVNGLGGGICQVSSTLYNAVLLANLEIVERKNHSYAVSYVPLGRDATVSYGSIDFKFKNNRKYPIKIVSSAQNGVLNISIMGIKEELEYDVSITTKKLKTIPFQTKYIQDTSMAPGTQRQTQNGDNGYKYETYKTLTLNGNVVSTDKISNDNYSPLTRIIRVGT